MAEYNTVVSTKISEEEYELVQQIAQERLKDPSISRFLRLLIRSYVKKYSPSTHAYNDINQLV